MTKAEVSAKLSYHFLRGGGDMGEVARTKDWSLSPCGNPGTWDQSLKITVSTCLNALTPVCIFWGDEFILFYNDAYSQTIGGVNPDWFGVSARNVRSDAFVLQSVLDRVVQSGKATTVDNHVVASGNNGHQVNGNFIFTCSPIFGDSEKVQGVFCTATQNAKIGSNQKDGFSKLQKPHSLGGRIGEHGFYNIFNKVPFAVAVLRGKELIIDFINQYNLDIWQCEKDDVLGKPLFEARPDIRSGAEPLHNQVFETGKRLVIEEIPFEFRSGEILTQKWFTVIIDPLRNESDEIIGQTAISIDVSLQVLARKKIQESEENFRSFADSIQNLAWMADGKGFIYWYNQRWYDYTGTTLDEMQGWGWEKVHHPDHVANVISYVKEAWHRPVPFELTFPLRSKEGHYRWFLTRCVPIKNDEGAIVRWIGTNTDIHEQKMAEERIRESEERFRTLAEALPQMVWMRNMEGQFEFASKNWEEYSGVNDIRQAWKLMTHPEDWERIMTGWQNASENGLPFNYEVRLKNKEGEYRWHYAVGQPVKKASGQVLKYIGAMTDVHIQKTFSEKLEKEVQERTTELKAKNAELENIQSFLQQLIDTSIEFIVVLDSNLNFLTVNKRTEDAMGLSRRELRGKNLFDVNPKAENTEQHKCLLRALQGETIYLEKRPTLANPDRYVDTYYTPLKGTDGIQGVIVMAKDVTGIVNSEKKLKQMNEELQRSNEDLQQFAHVASHDLKEPVRKIKTYLNRLDREFGQSLPQKGKEFIEKIDSASTRISSMIDGVLLYASVDALEEDMQRVSLKNIIAEILADAEIVVAQKNAKVLYSELPELTGIPVLLYQLFYNLINNALKFSKVGIAPIIQISAKTLSEYNVEQVGMPPGRTFIQVSIEDNGIGFEQSSAEEIFITFKRLNSKDKYEGTGLGLSLCKKIVERHGGIISAKSEPGKGSIFSIILPSNE